jgi:hypothetical protein
MLDESHMKTTLSCPYCIGWFQGRGKVHKANLPGIKPKGMRLHVLMSNLKPICGTKTRDPKYTEDLLTAPEALARLKLSLGCGHCIRKLEHSMKKGNCHAIIRIPLSAMWRNF